MLKRSVVISLNFLVKRQKILLSLHYIVEFHLPQTFFAEKISYDRNRLQNVVCLNCQPTEKIRFSKFVLYSFSPF